MLHGGGGFVMWDVHHTGEMERAFLQDFPLDRSLQFFEVLGQQLDVFLV